MGRSLPSPRPLHPSLLVDPSLYGAIRPTWTAAMAARKQRRRVPVGPHCTVLFENAQTVLFQIQEVLHIETGGRPTAARIAHEFAAYAPLSANPGELTATLFVQSDCRATGDRLVAGLHDGRVGVALRVGRRHHLAHVHPDVDPADPVKYLRFSLDPAARRALCAGAPAALLLLGPRLTAVQPLRRATRLELAADLLESPTIQST